MMTLHALHRKRDSEHEFGISEKSSKQYEYAINKFERFLGHEATLVDLNRDTMNAFIDELFKNHRPATVKLYRTHIMVLWRFAVEEDMVAPPRKIRKVRLPIHDPVAWTAADVAKLVHTALSMDPWPRYPDKFYRDLDELSEKYGCKGLTRKQLDRDTLEALCDAMRERGWRISNGGGRLRWYTVSSELRRTRSNRRISHYKGIPKHIWFASFIATGWDTGLRFGDLLSIKRSDITGSRLRIIQSKTKYPIECHLNAGTLDLIDRCLSFGEKDRDRVWPCLLQRHRIWWDFKMVTIQAGVPCGTFKYIRRGAGSAAEALVFGGGTTLLGHRTRDVTVRHYLDPKIVKRELVQLPSVVQPSIVEAADHE